MDVKRSSIVLIFFFCGIILLIYGVKYASKRQYRSFSDTFKTELTNISRINIQDGNTGEEYVINGIEDIEKIVNAFNKAEYKKNPRKEIAAGFTYYIIFFDKNDLKVFDFVVTKRTIYTDKTSYIIKNDISEVLDFIKNLIDE